MGRESLALGSHGRVRLHKRGSSWRAVAQYRDFDGQTRQVESTGKSKFAAEQALLKNMSTRSRTTEIVAPETKLGVVAEKWYSELTGLSPSTMQAYRDRLDRQVLPALGSVKVRRGSLGASRQLVPSLLAIET